MYINIYSNSIKGNIKPTLVCTLKTHHKYNKRTVHINDIMTMTFRCNYNNFLSNNWKENIRNVRVYIASDLCNNFSNPVKMYLLLR